MRCLVSFLFIFFLSNFAFSQDKNANDVEREISICRPELTESGRQSSFRFGYNYIPQKKEDGSIENVRYIKSKTNYESLADSSSVIPCIEKWKLKPLSKYRIWIRIGSNTNPNFLIISNKEEKIRIII
jgi:hypothetical protein